MSVVPPPCPCMTMLRSPASPKADRHPPSLVLRSTAGPKTDRYGVVGLAVAAISV
ncbi:hypothetical protein ACMXN5_47965 [Embleya sp. MST-111070]